MSAADWIMVGFIGPWVLFHIYLLMFGVIFTDKNEKRY